MKPQSRLLNCSLPLNFSTRRLTNTNDQNYCSKLNKNKLKEHNFNFSSHSHIPTQFALSPQQQHSRPQVGFNKSAAPTLSSFSEIQFAQSPAQKVSFSIQKCRAESNECGSTKGKQVGKNGVFTSLFLPDSLQINAIKEDKLKRMQQSEYQQTIKDLESRIRFEQKYANDLFRSNQRQGKELEELKKINQQIIIAITQQHQAALANLQLEAQDARKASQAFQQKLQLQLQETNKCKCLLLQKQQHEYNTQVLVNQLQTTIRSLQSKLKDSEATILQMKQQIGQFGQSYKNKLYQARIQELNMLVAIESHRSSQLALEKIRLLEQLELKDKQIRLSLFAQPKLPMENAVSQLGLSEVLLQHEQQIAELRHQLSIKQDSQEQWEAMSCQQYRKITNLQQQLRVLQLRLSVERSNAQRERQAAKKEGGSERASLQNQLKMWEGKSWSLAEQIKEKDAFMESYLLGRADSTDMQAQIQATFAAYKLRFVQQPGSQQPLSLHTI